MTDSSIVSPRVRPIEAIPFEQDGEELVLLRDPFHYQPNILTISVPAYLLLTFMNGKRTSPEIQQEFQKQFSAKISLADVQGFVEELDELGLLFTKRFEEMRQEALREFRDSKVRKAAHAGSAYEKDPQALRRQLDSYYAAMEKGPRAKDAPPPPKGKVLRGLVVPHIDLRAGGTTSAFAFDALRRSAAPPPDLFVLLGTSHQPGARLFSLTRKPFETPLGTVEVDLEAAQALQQRYPADLTEEEFLHKHEHSIEFPLLFLQHLYAESHPFKILPILAGSFQLFLGSDTLPSDHEAFTGFCSALRAALEGYAGRVCYVVGADLSHMGRKFGDEEGLGDDLEEWTRERDAEMLKHVVACRPEHFFRHLQADNDRQKVCGLPPMYTVMHALGDHCTAELLDYDISVEESTQSLVSFASIAFYGDPA